MNHTQILHANGRMPDLQTKMKTAPSCHIGADDRDASRSPTTTTCHEEPEFTGIWLQNSTVCLAYHRICPTSKVKRFVNHGMPAMVNKDKPPFANHGMGETRSVTLARFRRKEGFQLAGRAIE